MYGTRHDYDLATAHLEILSVLKSAKTSQDFVLICRILLTVLEKKPQMGQWNIELVLSHICTLCSPDVVEKGVASYTWLCKLVEIIIKKYRLRLEGHYHLLLSTLQALLRNLVTSQGNSRAADKSSLGSRAGHFGRLVTLVCEPTAGAVSRSQQRSSLDSATDVAKRTAGWHMYLLLMQYVKLQLEADVLNEVRVALEPAMNSIFDITPPEGRKILNDAMDGSGRAILREMYKRYTRFGKWSGV